MGQSVSTVDENSSPEQINMAFWMGCLMGELQKPEEIQRLLKLGVDINSLSPDGMTGLHCAAQSGRVSTVRSLLLCGVNNLTN